MRDESRSMLQLAKVPPSMAAAEARENQAPGHHLGVCVSRTAASSAVTVAVAACKMKGGKADSN